MQSNLRIAFAGTSKFAKIVLEVLINSSLLPIIVLTKPDKQCQRGMKNNASPVKKLASAYNIPIIQPHSLDLHGYFFEEAKHAIDYLKCTKCNVLVVVEYGLILPLCILNLPKFGCLNIHASILPRWRGAAPIHRAIEAGDKITGISIIQMDVGLDTGPIITSEIVPINDSTTTSNLYVTLANLGSQMIVTVLKKLDKYGLLNTKPQSEIGVSYAKKVKKEESILDWHLDALSLSRRIRAFDPFPGNIAKINQTFIKIWGALPRYINSQHAPGTIVAIDNKNGILVSCAPNEALQLTEIQRYSGKRMSVLDFMSGFPLKVGQRFKSIHFN